MNKKYRDERKSEVRKCTKEFHREDDCLICGCKVGKCKKIRHVKSKNPVGVGGEGQIEGAGQVKVQYRAYPLIVCGKFSFFLRNVG